jgi:hypothetical protein
MIQVSEYVSSCLTRLKAHMQSLEAGRLVERQESADGSQMKTPCVCHVSHRQHTCVYNAVDTKQPTVDPSLAPPSI